MARFTKQTAREFGRQGGRRTVERYGKEHMRAIGKRGFQATTDKHFGGDRRAHLNELIRRGLMSQDPCPWNGVWQNYTAFPTANESEKSEKRDP